MSGRLSYTEAHEACLRRILDANLMALYFGHYENALGKFGSWVRRIEGVYGANGERAYQISKQQ